ncbi:glycosyltransferase family 4 protein [Halorientalis sp. IM1011]|uniref:glycosyltransferase family 4 protein n=1 Tax=Halorientalis sp. IM1011 TaxID=1932360 RepID=UPI00156152EA|nr:glycosyltransferase family 4 protein [Halorientalis sp. IM1011]
MLVVADFTGNQGKAERHVGPLARVADPTMLCVNPPAAIDGVDIETPPTVGVRPLDLLILSLFAVVECVRRDYAAVCSFSLFPYGCAALVAGRVASVPTHLGVIGGDIDVHATGYYGPAVRWLMSRFAVVSVPGTASCRKLDALGVRPGRVATLTNPIRPAAFPAASPVSHRPIDLLWVGRFSREKDPVQFVDVVAEIVAGAGRGDLRAVMVGDGTERAAVESRIRHHGVGDHVELPGWVDDPTRYYRNARLYVLTSDREGLPLTLIEAMATGVTPVVPDVGNVCDVAVDEQTAVVIPGGETAGLVEAAKRLLTDDDRRTTLAENAMSVRETYSYEAAADDWRRILAAIGVPGIEAVDTGTAQSRATNVLSE